MARLTRGLRLSVTHGIVSLGLLLVVTLLILSGCGSLFFRRNPKLRMLRQDSGGCAFSPAWSPDGGKIYFLLGQPHDGRAGQLRVIKPDGSDERLLLDGSFGSVRVSPDGARLAVTTGWDFENGSLLWLDTSGRILDTLLPPTDSAMVAGFGKVSNPLYYLNLWAGVFRLDTASRRVDTVMHLTMEDIFYNEDFDIWDDSLVALPRKIHHVLSGITDSVPGLRQPRFCPYDPNVLMGVLGRADWLSDLVLVDRNSGSVTQLDAAPFYSCNISDPCWSPDGKSIVISAAEVLSEGWLIDGGQFASTYNLWVLER